jgi:hypothetical protein
VVITREEVYRFAEGWAAVWDARDLGRSLTHYSDDYEMTSPFIVKLMGEPSGTRKGRMQVGKAGQCPPPVGLDLHFEVRHQLGPQRSVPQPRTHQPSSSLIRRMPASRRRVGAFRPCRC